MRDMRFSVRQQLSLLLSLSSGIGLAVLALALWFTNHDFVLNVARGRLTMTASLKAAQIAFNLDLMQTAATFVTTRVTIQDSLARYNNGTNVADANLPAATTDLAATLGNVGPLKDALVLQAGIYSRNTSGPAGNGLVLRATGASSRGIKLAQTNSTGGAIYLGDAGGGYPPSLYPNLTIFEKPDGSADAIYNGVELDQGSTLVLGPLAVNETFSLLSLTLPIVNNTSPADILGWTTVITDTRLITSVIQDRNGLGNTGETLLVGPVNSTNLFSPGVLANTSRTPTADVRFVVPIADGRIATKRHPHHMYGSTNPPFAASMYPAVEEALDKSQLGAGDVGSLLRTHNEDKVSVSVGYAVPFTSLVNWIVIVEQARSEVWAPLDHIRTIILACTFAVLGFLGLMSFPIAHFAVLPILRLRAASEESIDPPHRMGNSDSTTCGSKSEKGLELSLNACRRKACEARSMVNWRYRKHIISHVEIRPGVEDRSFRIPGKVKQKDRFIKDEVTDLVQTFNEMSDELFMQYTKLEDRVRERTIELEHSRKAAEAANESKTLFVANVSHELKTPLNGILGISAVSLEEDDPKKLKRSLGIIYKSGDLLLRTLSDLLTFSTNQVGHQLLSLDEKEFVLTEVETQMHTIFGEQAREKQIDLRMIFESAPGVLPGNGATWKDAILWGDIHRIAQVLINLVSNALKFTAPSGSITLTVRLLDEASPRRRSVATLPHMESGGRKRGSVMLNPNNDGTANFINPHKISDVRESSVAPPGKNLLVEFEVLDTGAGIAEESQARIFEPFVQGEVGLNRKHSGTGLGLSICSQLAHLLKGSITLSSKLGEGSAFSLKIPLRLVSNRSASPTSSVEATSRTSASLSRTSSVAVEATTHPTKAANGSPTASQVAVANAPAVAVSETEKQAAEAPSSQAARPANKNSHSTPLKQAVRNARKDANTKKDEPGTDFSKVRVLVAEDNKVNQEVIIRMLKLEKILDVTIAEDGQAALDLVKTKSAPARLKQPTTDEAWPYDLVLMDIQMPRMDGITSAKLIRESGFTGPIVALTAYAEQSNIDECLGCGMDYFLAKPLKRPQLKKVLTEYCIQSPPAGEDSQREGKEKGENAAPTTDGKHIQNGSTADAQQPVDAQTTETAPKASAGQGA